MSTVHRAMAIGAAVLGLGAAAADIGSGVDPFGLAAEIDAERDHISAPELADRIMGKDATLHVFDLRPAAEYERFHIPSARQSSVAELARVSLPRDATVVVYSEGGTHAAQAWMLLRMRGYRQVYFLREGIYEWIARVHEPRLADDASAAERAEFEQAAARSRYFGGVALAGVPRAEVPTGYWSVAGAEAHALPTAGGGTAAAAREAIGRIRRRGC